MKVYNTEGITLGIVTDFLETGANDVLIIESEEGEKGKKEHLIPCVFGEHVLNVCLEKKEIEVVWDAEF